MDPDVFGFSRGPAEAMGGRALLQRLHRRHACLGDIVADGEVLRLLTALESFSGFALLSASVTYLLAVYRELIAVQSLASNVAGYFRAGELHSMQFVRVGG